MAVLYQSDHFPAAVQNRFNLIDRSGIEVLAA
jgi:hypothetical protein